MVYLVHFGNAVLGAHDQGVGLGVYVLSPGAKSLGRNLHQTGCQLDHTQLHLRMLGVNLQAVGVYLQAMRALQVQAGVYQVQALRVRYTYVGRTHRVALQHTGEPTLVKAAGEQNQVANFGL